MFAIAVLLIGVVSIAFAQPSLPELPDQFTANIEFNSFDLQSTYWRHEYYDYINNKLRVDFYTEDSTVSEIFDLNTDTMYKIENWDTCTVTHFNATDLPRFVNGTSHHLQKLSDLWGFGSQFTETYTGVQTARGILCDTWRSQVDHVLEDGSRWEYTLDWYFSVPEWKIYEGDHPEHRVPIQSVINGTHTHTNGTVTPINGVWEITFFEIGEPQHWAFRITDYFRCGATNTMDLPELPNQFQTLVEFTIAESNYSGVIYEFYDFPANSFRRDYNAQGEFIIDIWNFQDDHKIEIRNGVCTIGDFNPATIPFSSDNHIASVSSFFHFGSQYQETYEGRRHVRGIPCDMWEATINHEFDGGVRNYTLRYFFAAEDFEMYTLFGNDHEHRIPVRSEIHGARTYNNGTVHPFHHTYDFVSFQVGAPPSSVFDIPEEYVCRSNYTTALPQLPQQFSTGVEFTITEKRYTAVLRETYDYTNNRARIDFYRQGHRVNVITLAGSNGQPGKRIINENGICTVTVDDGSQLEDSTGHIRNVSSFFAFGAEFDEHYQGEKVVRGIPCDHWVTNITHNGTRPDQTFTLSYTLHYFFAVQEWSMIAHSVSGMRVPVRAEIKGHEIYPNGTTAPVHHVYDFVNFVVGDISDEDFTPSLSWNCPGYQTQPGCGSSNANESEDDDDNGNTGTNAGLVVVIVILALIALATGGVLLYQWINPKRTNSAGASNSGRDTDGRVELEEQ